MAKPTFTLRAGEQFFAEKVSADCWKMPQVIGKRQVSGKVYMTDQRVAVVASGLVGTASVSWEIEMKDIAFGIEFTMQDGKVYLLGIMKRDKYVAWIQEHIS